MFLCSSRHEGRPQKREQRHNKPARVQEDEEEDQGLQVPRVLGQDAGRPRRGLHRGGARGSQETCRPKALLHDVNQLLSPALSAYYICIESKDFLRKCMSPCV